MANPQKLSKPAAAFLSKVANVTLNTGSRVAAIQEAARGEVDELSFTEWMDVSSSNLLRYRYSEAGKALDIQFHNGGIWRYSSVPPFVWDMLTLAPSKGRYLHHSIKPRFPAKRVGGA